MLTYEALIGQARERGMPGSKMRGILREYLQMLILKSLYSLESGRKFCFTGGTYLRLLHQTKRFSEDLDFNAHGLSKNQFETTVKKIVSMLKKEGAESRVQFEHWENLWVAKIVFPEIERFYRVVSKYSKKEGIMIKVEVNRPRWKINPETLVASGYGQMIPIICTQKGALFADKIDALLKKNRVRHLFDLMFMLAQKYPIDQSVLKVVGVQEEPLKAIVRRTESFSSQELKHQSESLRPFLFDESQAEMIVNAKSVIRQLVWQYQKHKPS